ncbi:hypothetical protein BJY04DRAFT_231378 [Aspergillus karnatakaensis]|uniref:Zn(II)2Cys6 transcription factor domain-containing protein n=1 Tax=Aspergillus karnatakaensis TaxID=1810916 RepID=UPI003CCD61B0
MAGSFICHFPGCTATYRRKEHLTRHAAQHAETESFQCPRCDKQFKRSDTLRRHLRQGHGINEPTVRIRACQSCRELKTRCYGRFPCTECSRRQTQCSAPGDAPPHPNPVSKRQIYPRFNQTPTEQRAIETYFELFDPHWTFIHRGTLTQHADTPLVVQSVVVIGLWLSGEDAARSAARQLHGVLGSAILQQRSKWECISPPECPGTCKWPIPLYQSILLHILFFAISNDDKALGSDFKPILPSTASTLLSTLADSCRKLGMFHYPTILAQFRNDHVASYIWLCIEEIKRFNIALFRTCRRFSNLSDRVEVDELQFPPPAIDDLWNAIEQEDWNAALTKRARKIDEFDGPLEEHWISNSAGIFKSID